jgi:hypothetical protein
MKEGGGNHTVAVVHMYMVCNDFALTLHCILSTCEVWGPFDGMSGLLWDLVCMEELPCHCCNCYLLK